VDRTQKEGSGSYTGETACTHFCIARSDLRARLLEAYKRRFIQASKGKMEKEWLGEL
jgi:hypothetical protein